LPANSGIENIEEKVKAALDNGLSVLVFPEGTRSIDYKIHRFHRGAFYLAEKYKVDIIPAVIYGSGMVFSKIQPQYVAPAIMVMEFLPRITPEDTKFGKDYRERAKYVRKYIESQYELLNAKYNKSENIYNRQALIRQYMYKERNIEYSVYFDALKNHWYKDIEERVPRDAKVLDFNCEYGQVALMLSITSENRSVYAYSVCEEDFSIAKNSFEGKNITFFANDKTLLEIPECDVIILHRRNLSEQDNLLFQQYIKRLKSHAIVIEKN
jgi:hypothetical protein